MNGGRRGLCGTYRNGLRCRRKLWVADLQEINTLLQVFYGETAVIAGGECLVILVGSIHDFDSAGNAQTQPVRNPDAQLASVVLCEGLPGRRGQHHKEETDLGGSLHRRFNLNGAVVRLMKKLC